MSHILTMPGIPEHARTMLAQLLEEDLIPLDSVPHVVESYRKVIDDAHRRNGVTNAALGHAIADAALGLLASVDERTSEEHLRVIQAAIRFFVIQDNGSGHDLNDPHGLDDDARVMNAALRYLGRDHFFIEGVDELPPRLHPDIIGPAVRRQRQRRSAGQNGARSAPTQRTERPSPNGQGTKQRGGLLGRLRRSRQSS